MRFPRQVSLDGATQKKATLSWHKHHTYELEQNSISRPHAVCLAGGSGVSLEHITQKVLSTIHPGVDCGFKWRKLIGEGPYFRQ